MGSEEEGCATTSQHKDKPSVHGEQQQPLYISPWPAPPPRPCTLTVIYSHLTSDKGNNEGNAAALRSGPETFPTFFIHAQDLCVPVPLRLSVCRSITPWVFMFHL